MREEPLKRGADTKPFRCHCGSLLARLVPDGVELKCRRCKRQVVVPLENGIAARSEGGV